MNEILNMFRNCIFENVCEETFGDILSNMQTDYANFYDSGATKGVVVPYHTDYVIKIPFTCSYDSYVSEDEDPYIPFSNANIEMEYECGSDWDYCENEIIIYREAQRRGVEEYFVELEYIGSINQHPIYIQKKVNEIFSQDRDRNSYSKKDEDASKRYCSLNNVRCFNACWITDFINYYSEEAFLDLSYFLEEMRIMDLHGGNLGYMEDGRPVIFDWGGFND